MTREEARDELAHRWNAPTLMRAATAEYNLVRDWLSPTLAVAAWDVLDAMRGRNDDGGQAA